MNFLPARPLLFVDLDGTIRKGFDELGRFVNSGKDVELYDETIPLLLQYVNKGWVVAGITNQGGVAMGHMLRSDLEDSLSRTIELCKVGQLQLLHGVFACVHHPNAPELLERKCLCRKPNTGLLYLAQRSLEARHNIALPLGLAVMIGDRPEDEMCAAAAGIPFRDAKAWRQDWRERKQYEGFTPFGFDHVFGVRREALESYAPVAQPQ